MSEKSGGIKLNTLSREKVMGNLPYLIFFLSFIALIFRARLSFCWSDESFYFSTSNRFLQGDNIFVHEWFPTQLVSFILLPFHGLYVAVTGGNTGVILYFRVLYVVFSGVLSVCIYKILRKEYGEFTALAAGLFYYFYSHLNIATMSYYTLSYSFFLISGLLIYSEIKEMKTVKVSPKLVAAGSTFALSVLALPSLAVAYFLIVPLTLVIAWIFKSWRKLLFKILGQTFVGICLPAAPVLVFTLFTSGINGILENLEFVLSDEEHVTSLVYPFKNFFLSVYSVFDKRAVYAAVLLAVIGFVYACRKAKSNSFHKAAFLVADFALFLFFLYRAMGHTGFIATALLLFALPLFAITENKKKNWSLFVLLFVGGMLFSMVFSYSSMCDLYVLSIGHNIAAIGALCFVKDFIEDIKAWPKWNESVIKSCVYVCLAVMGVCLIQTMTLRFVNIYRDAPVAELNTMIDRGPAKGLYTTDDHYEAYNGVLTMIEDCNEKGNVFFTKLLPWGYLATDMKCGAPTTWRTKFNSDRLALYYEQHPEKIPDVVIILRDSVGSYDTCGDVERDPVPNENEMGGKLLEIVTARGYKATEKEYGIVLKK